MKPLPDLFLWTVGASASATLVALVVWLILLGGGRRIPSRGHYWLWALVLIRLVLPAVPGTRWSPFNLLPAMPAAVQAGPAFVPAGVVPAEPAPALRTPQQRKAIQAPSVPAVSGAGLHPAPLRLGLPPAPEWLDVAAGVWAAGAVGYFGFIMAQQIRFGRRVRAADRIADARGIQLLADVQSTSGWRGKVRLLVLDRIASPAVFGLLRPALLIPRHLLDQLSESELRHVLMHELAHVQRRDVLWNWMWIALQAWHWFNPVVWFVVRRLRAERELICDAAVLSRMHPGERSAYGATLLRLVSTLSQPVPAAGLVPVLDPQHQHNLERRIRMISKFQPPTRWANAAAGSVALVVAGMMFTRAAEKSGGPAPAPAPPPADAGPSAATRVQRERGIRSLEDEVANLEAKARERQENLNRWRDRLQITEAEERASGLSSKADLLRVIEGERINAQTKYAQSATLYSAFTNMSRSELRRTLPTASPDPLLARLLEEHALTEQRIAQSVSQQGKNSSEAEGHIRVLEKIAQQIEERLDGILRGLQLRLLSEREVVQSLERAAATVRQDDIKSTIERTPYYDAKRELEQLQFMKERLQSRLWQEKIEARLEENVSPGARP